jgi:hypothetical protein
MQYGHQIRSIDAPGPGRSQPKVEARPAQRGILPKRTFVHAVTIMGRDTSCAAAPAKVCARNVPCMALDKWNSLWELPRRNN